MKFSIYLNRRVFVMRCGSSIVGLPCVYVGKYNCVDMFCHYLFFIPSSFGVSRRLCLVITVFRMYLHLYFNCRLETKTCPENETLSANYFIHGTYTVSPMRQYVSISEIRLVSMITATPWSRNENADDTVPSLFALA